MTELVSLKIEDGIALVSVDNPPVNALSYGVRVGLIEAVRRADGDPSVQAIVLACAGRTYFAGFDIAEFDSGIKQPGLTEVVDVIEASSRPVVTAIHGTALGGGLEVALGCHFRIAKVSAKLGLPEVNLGLLPGAGGTQRLPRIVGATKALDMITSGRSVSGKDALSMGLVDRLAGEGELLQAAFAFAREVVSQGLPLKKVRDRDDMTEKDRANPGLFDAFWAANATKFRGYDAPGNIAKAIEAAVNLPFDEGMKEEERLFYQLYRGEKSKALRYSFFAEREAAKIPGLPKDLQLLPVAKVGVIGAGTMGGGIAMNFLSAGIPVTLVELKDEPLQRGLGVIRKNYEASVAKGRLSATDLDNAMDLLKPTLEFADLADCDLIIEAVFENLDLKRRIFADLDRVAKPDAILASNTSFLDLDAIASATSRPQSVVGMHFFSPANVMKLLEVVRGAKTRDVVLATVMKLARSIGKIAVVSGVCHGFIANRIFEKRQEEVDRMVLEGAMPWDIDRVILDYGFPMGHFQMVDLVGLDVIGWDRENTAGRSVQELLNEAGRHGQKTGGGYYDYDERRRPTPSPVTERIIREFAAREGIEQRSVADAEIVERCLAPMLGEAQKILAEGIALRASDIDVAVQYGYGWPRYRGGPMFVAQARGA